MITSLRCALQFVQAFQVKGYFTTTNTRSSFCQIACSDLNLKKINYDNVMIILFFVSFLQIVPPNKKIWESGDDGKGDISFLSNQWAPSNAWGNAPSGKAHSRIYPACSVSVKSSYFDYFFQDDIVINALVMLSNLDLNIFVSETFTYISKCEETFYRNEEMHWCLATGCHSILQKNLNKCINLEQMSDAGRKSMEVWKSGLLKH